MNPIGLYAMKDSKNQYNKEYYLETTLKFQYFKSVTEHILITMKNKFLFNLPLKYHL